MLTAAEILKIPLSRPDRLFGTPDIFDLRYREMVKQWHPDINKVPEATQVFSHINALADEAKRQISENIWSSLSFGLRPSGTKIIIPYLMETQDEISKIYVADRMVTYVYENSHRELATAFRDYRPRFLDHKMETELSKGLPKVVSFHDTVEGKTLLSVHRDPGLVRLADLRAHVGEIPPKHLMWIISVGLNLCCYLQVTKQVHGAINENTLWVDPQQHIGALLGGWGFNTSVGATISKLPATTVNRCPWIRVDKKATVKLDIASVREMALRLATKDLNPEIRRWLMMPSSEDAIETYGRWYEVLASAFGKRSFTKWDVKAGDVYF